MPSPQLENGYLKIANELFEKIYQVRLGGLQKDVLLCLIRFSYGFNKKDAELSVRFIAKNINSTPPRVTEALNKLISQNIVKVISEFQGSIGRILAINKDYSEWEFENRKQFENGKHKSSILGNTKSSKIGNNINTTLNTTINTVVQKDLNDIDFEKFWKLYSKKINKDKCYKKWKRLSKQDREKIFRTLPKYLEATPDIQYRKHPLTYLNNRSWEDEIIPVRSLKETNSNQNSNMKWDLI